MRELKYVVTAYVDNEDRPNLEILDFFKTEQEAQDYAKKIKRESKGQERHERYEGVAVGSMRHYNEQ